MAAQDRDWTKPAAMAIPKEGYFKLEQGRYGPIYPRTPACYGFTIIAKIKPGREEASALREENRGHDRRRPRRARSAEAPLPALGALRHRPGTYFMYQGIFDTDFDKYTEDAVALHGRRLNTSSRSSKASRGLEDEPAGFVKFVRDHQSPSFLEYGEYPYVSADEIKKALG